VAKELTHCQAKEGAEEGVFGNNNYEIVWGKGNYESGEVMVLSQYQV
jgi:hypothetical protein